MPGRCWSAPDGAPRGARAATGVCRAGLVALLLAPLLLAPPALAQRDADGAPRELWRAYPLDPPGGPAEARRVENPAPTVAREQREQVDGALAVIALVTGSLASLAVGLVVGGHRGRRVSPRPQLAPPAPPVVRPVPRPEPAGPATLDAEPAARAFTVEGRAMPVVGYISVAPGEPVGWERGLVAQEAVIRETCAGRGWKLLGVGCDDPRVSRPDRPGLEAALEHLRTGQGAALMVSHLDRLAGSAVELGVLLHRLAELPAGLVALDCDLDTSTPSGAKLADVLAALGDRERDKIAAGTRTALAAARAEGRPISRPAVSDHPQLRERIAAMRAEGMTLQAIADTLNREGVPTLRGGALWRPSSVQAAAGYKRPPTRPRAEAKRE